MVRSYALGSCGTTAHWDRANLSLAPLTQFSRSARFALAALPGLIRWNCIWPLLIRAILAILPFQSGSRFRSWVLLRLGREFWANSALSDSPHRFRACGIRPVFVRCDCALPAVSNRLFYGYPDPRRQSWSVRGILKKALRIGHLEHRAHPVTPFANRAALAYAIELPFLSSHNPDIQ